MENTLIQTEFLFDKITEIIQKQKRKYTKRAQNESLKKMTKTFINKATKNKERKYIEDLINQNKNSVINLQEITNFSYIKNSIKFIYSESYKSVYLGRELNNEIVSDKNKIKKCLKICGKDIDQNKIESLHLPETDEKTKLGDITREIDGPLIKYWKKYAKQVSTPLIGFFYDKKDNYDIRIKFNYSVFEPHNEILFEEKKRTCKSDNCVGRWTGSKGGINKVPIYLLISHCEQTRGLFIALIYLKNGFIVHPGVDNGISSFILEPNHLIDPQFQFVQIMGSTGTKIHKGRERVTLLHENI